MIMILSLMLFRGLAGLRYYGNVNIPRPYKYLSNLDSCFLGLM